MTIPLQLSRGRFFSALAWIGASVSVGLAASAASTRWPAPPPHLSWVAQSDYLRSKPSGAATMPREACSFEADIDPMLRIDDASGTVTCAEAMVLVVPASVAAVRLAMTPFLKEHQLALEPMRGNTLFAFEGWHPLLMARRPDLRRRLTNATLGPLLEEASAKGAFTEDEVDRLRARASVLTDRNWAEVRALPEFKADTEGYTGEVGRGNPRDNKGSGYSTRLQISDGRSFFGPDTTVVRLARVEAETKLQRTGGFLQLPFPLNLARRKSTNNLVDARWWNGISAALAPLATSESARARGWVVAESPADLIPAPESPAAPDPQLLWLPASAIDASVRFIPYSEVADQAGFSYPAELLALPDGSLLLAGQYWNRGEYKDSSVRRFHVDASTQFLKMERLWSAKGDGIQLRRGWRNDVWWRYDDASNAARMVHWSFAGERLVTQPMTETLARAPWIVHPELGPVFANRAAQYGFSSLDADDSKRGALQALPALSPVAASARSAPTGATLPMPGGIRQNLLRRISATTPASALLRVRDATASWWLDWSVYAVAFSDGALRTSGVEPVGSDTCGDTCLGSLKAGWWARKSAIVLPVRVKPGGQATHEPDLSAVAKLRQLVPGWQPPNELTVAQKAVVEQALNGPLRVDRFETVMLNDLRSGSVLNTVVMPGSVIEAVARSANGNLLAIASRVPDNYLNLVDMRDKARSVRLLVPQGAGSLQRLAFSWDGKTLWGSSQRGLIAWQMPREQQDAAHGDAVPDQVRF